MKRISDEKMDNLWAKYCHDDDLTIRKYATWIAQAQLEADKKEVQEIFEDIESSFSATNYHSPEAGRGLVNSIKIKEWQYLKQKYLGGKK